MAESAVRIREMGEGFLKHSPFSLPMISLHKKGDESYIKNRQ